MIWDLIWLLCVSCYCGGLIAFLNHPQWWGDMLREALFGTFLIGLSLGTMIEVWRSRRR